jgi:hypothetical protein
MFLVSVFGSVGLRVLGFLGFRVLCYIVFTGRWKSVYNRIYTLAVMLCFLSSSFNVLYVLLNTILSVVSLLLSSSPC